ncbi:MAG: nucleotidyltransferase family protein [Gammaproteobacteria bacterium]
MANKVQTKAQVFERLREQEPKWRALGVNKIGLFGSFVRDEASPESDVDLLVEFEPNRESLDNFMHLSFILEDVLQRPVELLTTEALSPRVGPQVLESVEYVHGAA